MIGNPAPGGGDAVSNALMSLLREDETDLKMRPDGSAVDLKEDSDDWNKEQERNDVVRLPFVE